GPRSSPAAQPDPAPAQDQDGAPGPRLLLQPLGQLEPRRERDAGVEDAPLDRGVRRPAGAEPEGGGVDRLLGAVAQVASQGRGAISLRRRHDLDARQDERRVLDLHGDPGRPDLEVVAVLVGAEVRVEVAEDARVGHLLALVAPDPVPVDPERPRRQGEAARPGGLAHDRASSSKTTLAKLTVPWGSGHWP